MSYLSGIKTEAQKYHEANAMQSREGATNSPKSDVDEIEKFLREKEPFMFEWKDGDGDGN